MATNDDVLIQENRDLREARDRAQSLLRITRGKLDHAEEEREKAVSTIKRIEGKLELLQTSVASAVKRVKEESLQEVDKAMQELESRDQTIELMKIQIKEMQSERRIATNLLINVFDFSDKWKTGDDIPPLEEVIEEIKQRLRDHKLHADTGDGGRFMYVPSRRHHYKFRMEDEVGNQFNVNYSDEREGYIKARDKDWRILNVEVVLSS